MQQQDINFVYLAAASNRLKIGVTWNIKLRLSQLSRQSGECLKLLAYVQTQDRYQAEFLEKELHREARQGGPWRGDWHPMEKRILGLFSARPGAVLCR